MTHDCTHRCPDRDLDLPLAGKELPPDLPERFTILRQIGHGGQGEVWLAEDQPMDQKVAIKIIDLKRESEEGQRLAREAQVGRNLAHPNLIRVFDLIELDKHLVIVMEYVAGGSLKEILGETEKLPISTVVKAAEQTLSVLAHLHEKGILHRDLKPSNLLIDDDGNIRLADLGLVRNMDGEEGLTRTGLAVGTPDYMSPEQVQGLELGPPSDLYGLGVTLFELLTGIKPFTGSSSFEVARQHLMTAPRNVRRLRPDCPRWLANFVSRLLEKRPRDRWPDATSALSALHTHWAPRWRHWRRCLFIAASVLVFAGASWVFFDAQQPRLEAVVRVDGTLVGVDAKRNELWRFDPGTPIGQDIRVADLTGDRRPEVLLTRVLIDPETKGRGCELLILDNDGHPQSRLKIDASFLASRFPGLSTEITGAQLKVVDLDMDGKNEILWSVSHPDWYPSMLGSWRPRNGDDVEYLLIHSGRIYDFATIDMNQDDKQEIIIVAVNNLIGFQTVLGLVDAFDSHYSPDLSEYLYQEELDGYLPIGPLRGTSVISAIDAASVTIQPFNAAPMNFSLAEIGNPRRRAFWRDLTELRRLLTVDPSRFADHVTAFRQQHQDSLRDAPMRMATSLLIRMTLASSGATTGAITVLEDAIERDPEMADLWLRLGEQRLIDGNRDAGRSALKQSLVADQAGRNPYDAPLFLTLDAALHCDDQAWKEGINVWKTWSPTMFRGRPGEFSPARSFFRGDWSSADFSTESSSELYRCANVMRLWARSLEGEADSVIAKELEDWLVNPETADAAKILEAKLLTKLGRTTEARQILESTLDRLEQKARTSYEAYVWLAPAEWTLAMNLRAQKLPQAKEHFERAAAIAPESVFARSRRIHLQ